MEAWLFIKGLSKETWIVSPGPGIVETLGGRQDERTFVPGLLFSFPTVKAASQAALRCHGYLAPMFPRATFPPMAVDTGPLPQLLPLLVFDQQAGSIVITQGAVKYLSGEPVDLLPGPDTRLESGETLRTKLLPASSLNVGWALPTLSLGERPPSYLKRGEPAVINISLPPKRGLDFPFPLPWKMIFLFGAAAVLLLVAYHMTSGMVGKMKPKGGSISNPSPPLPDALATPLFLDRARVDTRGTFGKPSSTPQPAGFGSVLIETEPADARIEVNHEVVAKKSPVRIERKSNQEVLSLTVTRKGYHPFTQIFNVEADRETVLRVTLKKK